MPDFKHFVFGGQVRALKDLLIPWYSFFRFASKPSVRSKPYDFCGQIVSDLNQLCLCPDSYSCSAVIYGSGPSLSAYVQALIYSCPLKSDIAPLRVALNSSVYAGLPTDLAFFETPVLHEFKELHNRMFEMGHYMPAFENRPVKFVFTNYCNDANSRYLKSASLRNSYILPQFDICLPRLRTSCADLSLYSAHKIATCLARLGVIPGAMFMRSSLIRTLLVLSSIGFKKFLLVGFDGGSSYFFNDEQKWPQLALLKSVTGSVYSRASIRYIKNGRLVEKKPHTERYHSTQDPSLSEYTNDCLVGLLSEWLNIEVRHWA